MLPFGNPFFLINLPDVIDSLWQAYNKNEMKDQYMSPEHVELESEVKTFSIYLILKNIIMSRVNDNTSWGNT